MRKSLFALALLLAGCTISGDVGSRSYTAINSPISRCMNMGSALEAVYEGQWGYTVRRSDLVLLKQAGFDTIRLPVRWTVHAKREAPYTIDPAMLARVDQIVGWASEIDLNIIVNVHHFSELNSDPDRNEPRLEGLWDQLSRHFIGAPDNLIFETINEPHRNMTIERTDALNARLLARIRQDHPDRWVILGTADWGQLNGLTASNPVGDQRVILTYHDYIPFDFTHQGAHWTDLEETGLRWGSRNDRTEMNRRLDEAKAVQTESGMPVFIGEFGVFQEVPGRQRARWTRALRKGVEARGMSWCYWDFAGELKAYDVDAEAWIPEIKAALLD